MKPNVSDVFRICNVMRRTGCAVGDTAALKKTNFMIFRPKQKQCDVEFNIFLNSHRVCFINEVGFLGEILDEHLTWNPHISHVARKMSKRLVL